MNVKDLIQWFDPGHSHQKPAAAAEKGGGGGRGGGNHHEKGGLGEEGGGYRSLVVVEGGDGRWWRQLDTTGRPGNQCCLSSNNTSFSAGDTSFRSSLHNLQVSQSLLLGLWWRNTLQSFAAAPLHKQTINYMILNQLIN